jgi:hypothetical protein
LESGYFGVTGPDHPIKGAIYHEAGRFEIAKHLFKFTYLRDAVKRLNYDYFVWLDSDNYFVRHPGDVLRVLAGAPVHATLESDLCRSGNQRSDWWGCPNAEFVNLMRAKGVRSNAILM